MGKSFGDVETHPSMLLHLSYGRRQQYQDVQSYCQTCPLHLSPVALPRGNSSLVASPRAFTLFNWLPALSYLPQSCLVLGNNQNCVDVLVTPWYPYLQRHSAQILPGHHESGIRTNWAHLTHGFVVLPCWGTLLGAKSPHSTVDRLFSLLGLTAQNDFTWSHFILLIN